MLIAMVTHIDEILEHPEKLEGISGLSQNREAFEPTLRSNYGTEMVFIKTS